MKFKQSFADLRRIFALVSIRKRMAMVMGLFVLSFVDLLGLAMLVPFLALATANANLSHKSLNSFTKQVFETVGLPHTIESVLAAFAGLILLKSVISIALMSFSANSVTAVTQKVRLRLARSLIFVRWPYLAHARVGALTNLVSSEASAMGEMFHSVANIIAMTFQVVVYLVLAFYISWPVALFALALGLLMFSWFGAVMRLKKRSAREEAQSLNKISAVFSDVLTGIRPMRGMGRVDRLLNVFSSQSRVLSSSLRLKLIGGDLSAEIFEPVAALAIAAWFYFVVSFWHLEFHNVLVIGLILIRVTTVLFSLYRLSFKVVGERQRYAAILNVIDEAESQCEAYDGTMAAVFQSAITISNVSFGYGKRPVLEKLNLTITKGSITAVAGPSGVGKSTLVDLLLGLQRPLNGTILVDGACLFETVSMQAWRAGIGYVPQEQFLLNDTIRNNVTLGDHDIAADDVVAALKIAEAWNFVEQLPDGMASVVGERGSALSGGQRQRICIARALVHHPRLLILDEATTALDPVSEQILCRNIVSLARKTRMTIVVISHQPRWMENADQVIRLPQGSDVAAQARLPRLAVQ
jgi:ATP-binding cassette subfamily C protein